MVRVAQWTKELCMKIAINNPENEICIFHSLAKYAAILSKITKSKHKR